MKLFKDFDFKVLGAAHYTEEAVREDIVLPILERLDYQTSGINKIIPHQTLTHPFIYLGTEAHKVNTVPDYLLAVNGTNVCTLACKAPNVDIRKGVEVEQAFRYALHPEIRTFLYGLCNGREICIYNWTSLEPVVTIPVSDLEQRWEELQRLLSPSAVSKTAHTALLPDFGLSCLKAGADQITEFVFAGTWVTLAARVNEHTYTLSSTIGGEKDTCLGSFNFSSALYDEFLSCVPDQVQRKIETALSQQPYLIVFTPEDQFELIIHARLEELIQKNEEEQYLPLTVMRFEPVLDNKQISGSAMQ